jgi:hypothetical protein
MSTHDERRRLPRRRTRVSAAAVDGDAVVACTIRDKSDSGARLLIQAGAVVPSSASRSRRRAAWSGRERPRT